MVVVVSLDMAWIWNTLAWIMRNESLVNYFESVFTAGLLTTYNYD